VSDVFGARLFDQVGTGDARTVAGETNPRIAIGETDSSGWSA
jgi:hypothetical protein